jgi:maleate isomerase
MNCLLISCANFGSAQIIEKLENKLKKPIIFRNTATFWASLRAAKITDVVEGFGQLLSRQ